jgi:hypothetical protein
MRLLDRSILFWLSTILASLCLVLVVANSVLILSNQSVRAEVDQRQQFLNQSIQLSRLNQELVNALAAAVLKNNNTAIRDLLASNGITVLVNEAPAGAAPPAGGTPPPGNIPLKK